jgi:hypothetical protein
MEFTNAAGTVVSSHTMTFFVLALALLQVPVPKNNPSGTWQADSGSAYEIRQNGTDVKVALVAGSNPKFKSYEVTLTNQSEANTYKGAGTFIAKMESGKECKFTTEWMFVVVSPDRIIGTATGIDADKNTCEIKQRPQLQLDLKKKK